MALVIDWTRLRYKTIEGMVAAALEWHLESNSDEQLSSLLRWWVEWWYERPSADPSECRDLLPSVKDWDASKVSEILDHFGRLEVDLNLMEFAWSAEEFFCQGL
jgi:hypothetical protein